MAIAGAFMFIIGYRLINASQDEQKEVPVKKALVILLLAAFKPPDVETMLAYHRAVLERSKGYILTLSKSDLDCKLDEPWYTPLPTVGVRIISVMADGLEHAGEAAYVRGLRQGLGWQKY